MEVHKYQDCNVYSTQTLPEAPFGALSAADIHSPVILTDILQIPKSRGTAFNKIHNCVIT